MPVDLRNIEELSVFLRDAATDIGTRLKPYDDWATIAFVVDPDGKLTIVQIGEWDTDVELEAYVAAVAQDVVKLGGVAAGMVALMWIVSTTTAGLAILDEPRPRDNPLREEALQVVTLDAEQILTALAIVTRGDDHPPELGQWKLVRGKRGGPITVLQKALKEVRDA